MSPFGYAGFFAPQKAVGFPWAGAGTFANGRGFWKQQSSPASNIARSGVESCSGFTRFGAGEGGLRVLRRRLRVAGAEVDSLRAEVDVGGRGFL